MRLLKVCFLIVNLLLFVQSEDDLPRIKTKFGDIQGYFKTSQHGKIFEAYEGIPFALPPVGKLRFQPPHRISAWPGEFKATKLSDQCMQYGYKPDYQANENVQGSEDCLYLNIYLPKMNEKNTLLPVLFWIHGGGFTYGSGTEYGAKYIIDENVILVTSNHRLGPLGFLSTEDDVVSGNMGLKDQSMALKWIHDNIESFSGNPEKITLVGHSSGAASVHYHYLSPLSNGLFQNGLSFSGSVLNSWAQTKSSLQKAKKLAALLGCTTKTNIEMMDCLRLRPGRVLIQAVVKFHDWLNAASPFGPVVEKPSDHAFITQSPIEILKSGNFSNVPWLAGVTNDEGLYPAAEFIANKTLLQELNDKWEFIIPNLLDFNFSLPLNLHAAAAKKIRQHYLGNLTVNIENTKPIIQMQSDRSYIAYVGESAKLHAMMSKSSVWLYQFSYRGAHSISEVFSGSRNNFGVSHGDDMSYIFENLYLDPTTTESDLNMQKDLVHLVATYTKKGIPDLIQKWRKVDPTKNKLNFLSILGPGQFVTNESSNFGDINFWNSLHFAENGYKPDYALE